ncbi:MAG: histidinol dehydrogenase [Sterolibacterium sp.]|nr:histidinol dehydrogenase [Sterolibacterium sp.]
MSCFPLRRLTTQDADFPRQLTALLAFESATDDAIERQVEEILRRVRAEGDAAVLEYTRRFDHLEVSEVAALELPGQELAAAFAALPPAQRTALEQAASRIRLFHERQKASSWEYEEAGGVRLGQKITPLDRVGLYVPGGKASYPSSVLMNALPAKVAGVRELIMVTPIPHGQKNPLVLAAAYLAGVDRLLTIGGAQAIAALAYGTQTIPQVDKIVGPGNAYVAAAKRRVFGTVGIDMVAGPSEILIIADASAHPDWIAMDMFAQAEHDELAQSILLTPEMALIDKVAASMERLLSDMPRRAVIEASLAQRGALVQTRDLAEACMLANRIAPEHLELAVADPRSLLDCIHHAGAIFLGHYTSESLGDYCAGPNHVLPTSGSARFSSPLGVYDFQKRSSLIEFSAKGARVLGQVAATLAHGEGLTAHARAAELRMQDTRVVWDESYGVGVASLDIQHRTLIDMVNHLRDFLASEAALDGVDATFDEIMTILSNYTRQHFTEEEAYMRATGYDGLATHIQEHAAFIGKIDEFRQSVREGQRLTLTEVRALQEYLGHWVLNHIAKSDQRYRNHVRQSAAGA